MSWVIHQIVQAICNHNHKLWIVRDQLHNQQQNFPNEDWGRESQNTGGKDANT